MKSSNIKQYYRRNLPHIQPIGFSFFVTFRLHGSLPKKMFHTLKREYENSVSLSSLEKGSDDILFFERKKFFAQYDKLLDTAKSGPKYLGQPEVADIVKKEIHRFDGELFRLVAYCIMSNHVHLLIDTDIQIPQDFDYTNFESMEFKPLDYIMFRIKGASARYANMELGRVGEKFWQRESYDHFIRNEKERENVIQYILNNPVKAGVVEHWKDYPHTYCNRYL